MVFKTVGGLISPPLSVRGKVLKNFKSPVSRISMCSLYIYVQVCLDGGGVFEPISLFEHFPFDTFLILEALFNTMAAARNYAL